MARLTSKTVFGLTTFILIALSVNFDNILGNLFLGMALLNIALFILDKKTPMPIERTRNLKRSFTLAIGGLFTTYIVSYIILSFFRGYFGLQSVTLQSLFQLLAEQNLIFQGNLVLTVIALGFIVPIQETWLQANMMDFFRDIRGTNLKKFTFNSVLIFSIIISFFVFIHFNVKGLLAAALVPVAVFFVVSYFVILIENQTLGAKIMHIINNNIALAITFGLIAALTLSGPILIGGLVVLGLFLLFKLKILRQPIGGG